MDFATYKTRVKAAVNELSPIEKLAICLVCCDRLSPLYESFSDHHKWGDIASFADSRAQATEILSGTVSTLKVTTKTLERNIPNTEDFGSVLGSFALNSGCAHLALIRQADSNDPKPVIDALLMCYETIHFCVQEDMDPTSSRSIPLPDVDGHEMMKRETAFQLDSLASVRDCPDLVEFVSNPDDQGLAKYMLNIARNSIAR